MRRLTVDLTAALSAALLLSLIFFPAASAQTGVAISLRNGTTNPANCSASGANVYYNRTSGSETLNLCNAAGSLFALASVASTVPTTRTISTTAPLGGGGDLSADRTFTCTLCLTSAANSIVLGNIAQIATNTILGNSTNAAANISALSIGSCSSSASALIWTTNTGFGCNTIIAASTVTTNANLTGPITSVGNATSVAAQTGTGSTFVMQASPTLTTPNIGAAAGTVLTLTNSSGGGTFVGATSGTNAQYLQLQNTSGAFILGVDSSVGGNLFVTGTAAYETVLTTQTATGLTLAPALTKRFRFSGTDFAALSIGNTITPGQTGGIVGTTTNNEAQAGSFGQFITARCPGPATTATITVTIASPAVVTWTSHPFSGTSPRFDACPVVFTTGGALPTGITAATNYWVIPTTISGNNFSIATSVANAIAGTAVNTSGTQSGTHTGTAGTVLSTGATKDVTGLALTAGDWDCSGAVDFQFGSTTSYTNLVGSISTTAATLGGQDTGFDYETAATIPTATADVTWPISDVRQLLSGTTNVFLVTQATFTASTLKTYGSIRCRRVR
jgi:hypothetical protein